jgi:hypothetical protein
MFEHKSITPGINKVSANVLCSFKDRFLWSIDARGLLDHLEGSKEEPTYTIDATIRSCYDFDTKQVLTVK